MIAVVGFLGVLGGLLALGAIAEDVREQEANALDAIATPLLHGIASPALDAFMRAATELGSTVVIAPLFAGVVLGLLWKRHRREAALFFVAMAGSLALNESLKLVFHRPRPQLAWAQAPPEYSFPSGHAMNSLVFYLTLSMIVWFIWGRRAGLTASTVALAIAAVVGTSRIYLGYHYLTDVAAGYLAGFVWLLVVATVFEVGPRLRRHTPPRPAGPGP